MELYLVYFGIVAFLNLLLYLFLARERIRLYKKLIIFAAALLITVFNWLALKDMLGRPSRTFDNGHYIVNYAYTDKNRGEVYFLATAKLGDSKFKPKLLVVPVSDLEMSDQELSRLIGSLRKGDQLEFTRNKSANGKASSNYKPKNKLKIFDPLGSVLPSSKE